MTPGIRSADDGPIRVLTIDNPAQRNAFTGAMAITLLRELERADADPTVRAIVVTGAEGYFSSGHDLNEVLESPETGGDPVANAAVAKPPEILTPVIAAVDGPAYAAGFLLTLNCDLRVASRSAKFCGVGAAIGIVPIAGALSRLPDLVGYPTAFRWLATAAPFGAEEAERHGYVAAVHDGERALDGALELAHRIATVSPAVVTAIKAGLLHNMRNGPEAGRVAETQLSELVRALPDGDEGVRSFLDRRPATFPDVPEGLHTRVLEMLS